VGDKMASFFRTSAYLCYLIIIFCVLISFVVGLGYFGDSVAEAGDAEDNIISSVTGLSDGMDTIWLAVTLGSGVAAVVMAFISHSMIPIGIYLFSVTFWTAYIKGWSMIESFNLIPSELAGFILAITVGITLLFIAAVIGMTTGSG